jgi:hypothetical protein
LSQSNLFLATFLQLPVPKTRLNSIPLLPIFYPGRLASRNSTLLYSTTTLLAASSVSFYNPSTLTTQKTHSIVKEACLLLRCLAMDLHVKNPKAYSSVVILSLFCHYIEDSLNNIYGSDSQATARDTRVSADIAAILIACIFSERRRVDQ